MTEDEIRELLAQWRGSLAYWQGAAERQGTPDWFTRVQLRNAETRVHELEAQLTEAVLS